MTMITSCPNCKRPVEDDTFSTEHLVTQLERHIKGFYGETVRFDPNGSDTIECCTGCQHELNEAFMEGRGAVFQSASDAA